MHVSVADAGTLRKQVTITYEADEVTSREAALLERYAGRMKVNGFRNGKVPSSLVKKRFGTAVTNEVQQALADEGLRKAMSDNELKPIGPMTNDETSTDAGLTFKVSFDVQPEIELPEPEAFDLPKGSTEPSDDEVTAELDQLRQRAGDHQDVAADATLIADDAITLTGKITAGEETVREIHDLSHIVGGYPIFGKEPSEVIELVADKKVGDAITFDTTLPGNFKPEAWAEKEVHIELTIQSAKRTVAAELDDDFAKKLGAENVEDLKTRVVHMIQHRKGDEQHRAQVDALTEQLIEKTSFELPPTLFAELVSQNLEQVRARAGDGEFNEDERKAEIEKEVERNLRQHLLLEAIASKYEVQASQQDLNQQIAMAAYQSGRKPEELARQLQESGRIMDVVSDIRQHKALELLRTKIVGEEEEHSHDHDHDHEHAH